jgi:hypothetical protein|tara:strand:- start:872 stop:1018 length:147 start_codon:yes stop_codon:yes gene_type:complete
MNIVAGKIHTSIEEAVNAILHKEHMILFLYEDTGNGERLSTVEGVQDH